MSDIITAEQLWNDVAAIFVNPTEDNMEYQVPQQNYKQQIFQDFTQLTRFKFQTIKYHFENQTNYGDENDFFLPEVVQKLPSMESFTKLNHFFESFSEWCQEKINSIQYFLNSPYGADIDNTSGNVEFTLSHESSGIKRKDIKNAVKSLRKYGLEDTTHLIKITDLIRVLNFFTVDISQITDNITPLGGPTQIKQPPYITQMNPDAITLFKNFLDNIDGVNGYSTEDDEYSQSGNKRRIFKGVGKDLIEPIDEIITSFQASFVADPPPSTTSPSESKVEVLPPLWHTRVSRSTGKIVYQHPHCAPTYTHPRELTYEHLDKLIQKRFGTLTQKNKEEEQNWVITSSKSKNGYVKYIADSGKGKPQYENPWAKSTSQVANLHHNTINSNSSATPSNTKKFTKLKLDTKTLADLASRRKKNGGGKTKKRKRKTNKRKRKTKKRKRKTKKRKRKTKKRRK